MRISILLVLQLIVLQFSSNAQEDSVLVCDVHFKESKFDNAHAGSGFLVSYKDKYYACTAKHVLYFAKTDKMNSVSFQHELDAWTFHPKGSTENVVVAGKLINEDQDEKLQGMFKGDWLIFELEGKVPQGIVVYEVRDESKPLVANEPLRFLGYPYKKANNEFLAVDGQFSKENGEYSFSMTVPPAHYNGCSGGPVLDQEGKLVGLVSMGQYNEKTGEMSFSPSSVKYFIEMIRKHQSD